MSTAVSPWERFLDQSKKPKASRLSFGEALVELGRIDRRVVALDADLSKSTRTDLFAAEFPSRFFNCGIAEANMIGVAAGLAGAGKIPYAASFGCFLTGRYDQIRMSVSFSGAPVRLIGTHAGVGIGEDGHSQMALEDLGLMRALPDMVVLQPGDEAETKEMMHWSLNYQGPVYFRLTRQNLFSWTRPDGFRFTEGTWWPVGPGLDANCEILVLGTGSCLQECVRAADHLRVDHVVSVYNAGWIKPYDIALLETATSLPKLKQIVTVEDHYVTGGLGSLVAEYLAGVGSPIRLQRIGITDFGQSGSPEANLQHYELDHISLVRRIKAFRSKT